MDSKTWLSVNNGKISKPGTMTNTKCQKRSYTTIILSMKGELKKFKIGDCVHVFHYMC